jgi:hypothetical protein
MRFILWGRRRSATLSAVVAGVAATGVVAATVPAQAQPDPLHRFEHQTIAWHDCRTNPNDLIAAQLAAAGALCGEMRVPLDYRHPAGRTISIAVDRRPATGTAHKLGTLVVNAGGPDESRSAIAVAQSGAPALGAQYDLVSFDPRFFGLSTPLNCGWPTDLEAHGDIATPDRTAFDANVAASKQLASLCAPYADKLPFASTRDIARDMDILATTAPFGPTRTARCGSTRRSRDGLIWPRFKQSATRRSWSQVGPNLADISTPRSNLGPVRAVPVGPLQAVVARHPARRAR